MDINQVATSIPQTAPNGMPIPLSVRQQLLAQELLGNTAASTAPIYSKGVGFAKLAAGLASGIMERKQLADLEAGQTAARAAAYSIPSAGAGAAPAAMPSGGTPSSAPSMSSAPSASSTGANGGAMNTATGQLVYNELSKRGVSPSVAAGAVGSLMGESGVSLNPGAIRPNDAGQGLDSAGMGQWNRERLNGPAGLFAFAGMDPNSPSSAIKQVPPQVQAAFIGHELDTTHAGALTALQKGQTIADGANAWTQYYEGAKGGAAAHQDRIPLGQQFAASMQAQGNAPKPSGFGGPIARAADGTPVATDAQGNSIDPRTGKAAVAAPPQQNPDIPVKTASSSDFTGAPTPGNQGFLIPGAPGYAASGAPNPQAMAAQMAPVSNAIGGALAAQGALPPSLGPSAGGSGAVGPGDWGSPSPIPNASPDDSASAGPIPNASPGQLPIQQASGPQGPLPGDFGTMGGPSDAPDLPPAPSRQELLAAALAQSSPDSAMPNLGPGTGAPSAPLGPGDIGSLPPMAAAPPPASVAPPPMNVPPPNMGVPNQALANALRGSSAVPGGPMPSGTANLGPASSIPPIGPGAPQGDNSVSGPISALASTGPGATGPSPDSAMPNLGPGASGSGAPLGPGDLGSSLPAAPAPVPNTTLANALAQYGTGSMPGDQQTLNNSASIARLSGNAPTPPMPVTGDLGQASAVPSGIAPQAPGNIGAQQAIVASNFPANTSFMPPANPPVPPVRSPNLGAAAAPAMANAPAPGATNAGPSVIPAPVPPPGSPSPQLLAAALANNGPTMTGRGNNSVQTPTQFNLAQSPNSGLLAAALSGKPMPAPSPAAMAGPPGGPSFNPMAIFGMGSPPAPSGPMAASGSAPMAGPAAGGPAPAGNASAPAQSGGYSPYAGVPPQNIAQFNQVVANRYASPEIIAQAKAMLIDPYVPHVLADGSVVSNGPNGPQVSPPPAKNEWDVSRNGIMWNKATGQRGQGQGGEPLTKVMSPDEVKSAGLNPGSYQRNTITNEVSPITSPAGNDANTYSEPMVKALGDYHASLAAGVPQAQANVRAYNAMQGALQRIQSAGGTTGFGAAELNDLKGAINTGANLVGIAPPNDISNQEEMASFGRTLAGGIAKSVGGSRVTNFEMKNFLEANPGLDLSAAGNQRLIGIGAQIEQRKADIGGKILDTTTQAMQNGQRPNAGQVQEMIKAYDADPANHIRDPISGQDLTQNYKLPASGASNGAAPPAVPAQMQPTASPPQKVPMPVMDAIPQLRANPTPQMRQHFDDAYGAGASAKVLGQ